MRRKPIRFWFLLLILLGVPLLLTVWAAAQRNEPLPLVTVPPAASAEALHRMRELNSSKYAGPPNEFRPGHVTARTLDPKAIQRGERGFRVTFPSRAPVVTPAVYDGKVFVSGGFRSKEFYALDAETGKLAWAADLDDDGPSTPACEDDICVFNTESCTIFTLQTGTGKLLWSWWLGDPLMSAPTVANGRAFTAYPTQNRSASLNGAGGAVETKPTPPGMTHALAAFDLKTGEIVWQKWLDSDVISAPVASDGRLHVNTFAGGVYQFDQTTGEILAAKQSRATSAPIVVGEDVYYSRRSEEDDGDAKEALVKEHRDSLVTRWMGAEKRAPYLDKNVQADSKYFLSGAMDDAANGFAGGAPASASAGVAMDLVGQSSVSNIQAYQGSRMLNFRKVNFSSMGDELVATHPESGEQLWSRTFEGDLAEAGGHLLTPPAAAGGSLFVGTLSGDVLRIDPDTGKTLASYDIGAPIRSQPVIEGGWIYVGTVDGQLVATKTGNPKDSGWPMWGGDAGRTGVR